MNGRNVLRGALRLFPVLFSCLLLSVAAEAREGKTTFKVTTHAGPHGTVSPASASVAAGESVRFTIVPEDGYAAMVSGCGGSASGTTYTTAPVNHPCRIKATFLRVIPPNKEM